MLKKIYVVITSDNFDRPRIKLDRPRIKLDHKPSENEIEKILRDTHGDSCDVRVEERYVLSE